MMRSMNEFGETQRANNNACLAAILLITILVGAIEGLYLPLLNPLQFWISDLASKVALPIALLWLAHKKCKIAPSDYGLECDRPYPLREWLALSIFCAILLYTVDVLGRAIGQYAKTSLPAFGNIHFTYADILTDGALPFWFALCYFAVTAGVFQEIFYRGLFKTLQDRVLGSRRPVIYVLLSSFVFGLVHWKGGILNVVQATAVGMTLSILYVKFGDLKPLIVAHTTIDVLQGL